MMQKNDSKKAISKRWIQLTTRDPKSTKLKILPISWFLRVLRALGGEHQTFLRIYTQPLQ